MIDLYTLFIHPLVEFGFLRRALVACVALALGCGPIGVFMLLRRMSLVGDAMSHAVLPGAAVGFLVGGLSLGAMGLGGFVAGLAVALLAGLVSRHTLLREDASFAAFYLISLALGVLLLSLHGAGADRLLGVLFGSILGADDTAIILMALVATVTLVALAGLYRPLVADSFDPGFLKASGGQGGMYHALFLGLVVLNLVGAFQALGTLMAVGLMMLPAAASRFWSVTVGGMIAISTLGALFAGYAGLLASYHLNLPSGPAIVLTAGLLYGVSVILGRYGSVRARFWKSPRLA